MWYCGVSSYRAWSAERDRPDGMSGTGGKPQQYGRDGGGHNVRDGYTNQPPPRQWDNRGGYRPPFVPQCVTYLCLFRSLRVPFFA